MAFDLDRYAALFPVGCLNKKNSALQELVKKVSEQKFNYRPKRRCVHTGIH